MVIGPPNVNFGKRVIASMNPREPRRIWNGPWNGTPRSSHGLDADHRSMCCASAAAILDRLRQNRGIFNTPMVAGLGGVEPGKLEVFNRALLSRIGQPEEAASVWAFLLSDEAKYSRSYQNPQKCIFGCLWENQ